MFGDFYHLWKSFGYGFQKKKKKKKQGFGSISSLVS